jgi:hypothetical protein
MVTCSSLVQVSSSNVQQCSSVVCAASGGAGVDASISAAWLAWHQSNSQSLISVRKEKMTVQAALVRFIAGMTPV